MLVLALASFGAIIVAWLVAPEAKGVTAAEPTPVVPAGAMPARA